MRTIFLVLLLFNVVANFAQNSPVYRNPDLPALTRAEDLLKRMSPEEKFWQLFMLTENWELPKDRYRHGVFGFESNDPEIFSDTAGLRLLDQLNRSRYFFKTGTRLGIPVIPFCEALHGVVYGGATVFPQSIGLAATFDTAMMHRVTDAIAEEARGCGFRMVLSPVLNLADDPRWGRTEETYGEDPFLASRMGSVFTSSFESRGIIATPKHFIVNSGAGGRDSYPVNFNERLLEEYYFPPFRESFRCGARSVMAAYNSLDGSPCTANDWLLNKKLKEEWGFTGFVISDAGATGGSNCLHMTAADYHESVVNALNGGLDVIFQTDYDHYKLFLPAFLDGSIPQEIIDRAVTRVLRAKFELGLFEEEITVPDKVRPFLGTPEHVEVALEAARKSLVLLKNDKGTLPFPAGVNSILVVGPDAVEARFGGYSGQTTRRITILDGIRATAHPGTVIDYLTGCGRSDSVVPTVPNEYLLTGSKDNPIHGLKGEYFDNPDLAGDPVFTRRDSLIDFRWTLYGPSPELGNSWYSVRWSGFLVAPISGQIHFGIEGNDGFRLYLNDSLIINRFTKVSWHTDNAAVNLIKGKRYSIRIEFREPSENGRIRLFWEQSQKNDSEMQIRQAVEAAGKNDAVIVVAGIEEGEGKDRAYLGLPGRQEELINRLSATGKPVVVVLVGGSAITMDGWLSNAQAVLDAWYPGEQGGTAVAEALFGQYNPGGCLPVTFPKTEGQLPMPYLHAPTGRNDDYTDDPGVPLFPFGYGLSYTTFEYTDPVLDRAEIPAGETALLSFLLKNTGSREGEKVIQLYIRDELSSVVRPLLELKGFRRVPLKAGESVRVEFRITPEMLSISGSHSPEPGRFRLMIGESSKEIRLMKVLSVTP